MSIKTKFKQFLESKLSLSIQKHVLLIPGELFFCKHIQMPDGIAPKDIEGFLEVTLESLSPFPIEQLLWGFIKSTDSKNVLIYAALQDKVNILVSNIQNFPFVLPSFFPFTVKKKPQSNTSFVRHKDTLSMLMWNKEHSLPVKIESMRIDHENEELGIEDIKRTQDKLISLYCPNKDVVLKDLQTTEIDSIQVMPNGIIEVEETTFSGSADNKQKLEKQTVTFKGKTIWESDIRNSIFIKKEKSKRQMCSVLWGATIVACIIVVFIALGEGLQVGGKIALASNVRKIKKREPIVSAIENKEYLTRKIEQITRQELRPFEMLAILNQKRPQSIYFTSVTADNIHNMTVEGFSENSMFIDNYSKELASSNLFDSVEITNLSSTNQGAKFTLQCNFSEAHSPYSLTQES